MEKVHIVHSFGELLPISNVVAENCVYAFCGAVKVCPALSLLMMVSHVDYQEDYINFIPTDAIYTTTQNSQRKYYSTKAKIRPKTLWYICAYGLQ